MRRHSLRASPWTCGGHGGSQAYGPPSEGRGRLLLMPAGFGLRPLTRIPPDRISRIGKSGLPSGSMSPSLLFSTRSSGLPAQVQAREVVLLVRLRHAHGRAYGSTATCRTRVSNSPHLIRSLVGDGPVGRLHREAVRRLDHHAVLLERVNRLDPAAPALAVQRRPARSTDVSRPIAARSFEHPPPLFPRLRGECRGQEGVRWRVVGLVRVGPPRAQRACAGPSSWLATAWLPPLPSAYTPHGLIWLRVREWHSSHDPKRLNSTAPPRPATRIGHRVCSDSSSSFLRHGSQRLLRASGGMSHSRIANSPTERAVKG